MVKSRGCGTRYSRAERTRLLRAAHQHRAQGWSWARIGDALGLPGETLRWWSHREAKAGSPRARLGTLVPVTVTAASEAKEPESLTVVTPSGWRIEGLSAGVALELLRRLGC